LKKIKIEVTKNRRRKNKFKRKLLLIDTNITPSFIVGLKKFCIKRPCPLCSSKLVSTPELPNSITLDHIVPLKKGGKHYTDNVYCICSDCNSRKKHYGNYDRDMLLKYLNNEYIKRLPW
jgi:5-methylcytosine-specific restriction endonuclease McrA